MKSLVAIAVVASLASAASVEAGPIASRAALQVLLGGPGTLEDFENFNVGAGSAALLDCPALNSSAICDGAGPGLVKPGLNITFGDGPGQWDGAGYVGSPSKEILSNARNGPPVSIDFASAVGAFGLDLRAFVGFPATATMTVYGADDVTVIGVISGIGLVGTPVFAGWEDASGIGLFQVTQVGQSWSPIVDNLEYGEAAAVIPEPASLLLVGTGLVAAGRRRLRRYTRP